METSGLLPLLTKENFLKWYGADKRRTYTHSVAELQKELYREGDEDQNSAPLGIVALYELVKSKREDLIGPNKWSEVAEDLGDLIGSGTFGMVFKPPKKNDNDDDKVTKVSKSSIRYWIDREIRILQLLKEDGELPPSVPCLLDDNPLKVSIGGVDMELPLFSIKPVCQEIYSLGNLSDDLICKVIKDIIGALEFIHSKGIAYNDVNDRNVLVRKKDNGDSCQGVLIDFSIASPLNSKVVGFKGTPDFTHRNIHKMRGQWIPEYDYASLGLTAVVFLNQGLIPWKSFCGIRYEYDLNERMQKARESFNANNPNESLRNVVDPLLEMCEKEDF